MNIRTQSCSSRYVWMFVVGVFLLNVLLYSNTLNFGFVWDDERTHLTANEKLIHHDAGYFWTNTYEGLYIPAAYTVWSMITLAAQDYPENPFRLAPKPYHIANVIVHAFNAALLFVILILIFNNSIAALLGALLFSVHPMQVASVAWISEFRGLLSAFFAFVALLLYFLYMKGSGNKFALVASSTIAFLVSLLCKPAAVVLPLFILVFEIFSYKAKIAKAFILPVAWLLLTIPFAIITGMSQPAAEMEFVTPLPMRPLIAGHAAAHYFYKLLLPLKLSASYGFTPEKILGQWFVYVAWILSLGLLIWSWIWRNKYPWFIGSVLILFIGILPVSGIVPFYYQQFSTVADRYIYLPMLGPAFFMAGLFISSNKKMVAMAIIIPVLIVLTVLNVRQQAVWANELSLWNDVIEKYPGQPHVYNNLGITLHNEGKYQDAVNAYTEAITIEPEFVKAYSNRANSYAFQQFFERALEDYSRAIDIDPDYARAYYNRSVTYFQLKRYDLAYKDLIKAKEKGYFVNPAYEKDLLQRLHR